MQVELSQSERGTQVRMTVETEAARHILTDAQPRLLAEARAQGVRIAETAIDLSSQGQQANSDARRQAASPDNVFIRTARGLAAEVIASADQSAARSDRYA